MRRSTARGARRPHARRIPYVERAARAPTKQMGPYIAGDDLELAVLDLLDRRLVVAVAVLEEREFAERGGQVLDLGEAGLDALAVALHARLLDGLGDDEHAGIGLGGELVRIDVLLLHVGEEGAVGGIRRHAVPRGSDIDTLRGGTGVLDEGRAIEPVTAHDGHVPAELARLRDDAGGVLGQGRHEENLGVLRLERGELGIVVAVGLGKRLGADDLDPQALECAFHDGVAGLREGVVIAIKDAGRLEAELAWSFLTTPG